MAAGDHRAFARELPVPAMKTRRLRSSSISVPCYAKRPLDLIVSIGAPAAAFVQRHRQQLFADTPMVFTAVEQRRVQYSNLTPNDTVVAVAINYPGGVREYPASVAGHQRPWQW